MFNRKYIISCKQTEVPLSVPWDPSNQVMSFQMNTHALNTAMTVVLKSLSLFVQMYLSYNNVSALKLMDTRNNWVLTSEKNKVSGVFFLSVKTST